MIPPLLFGRRPRPVATDHRPLLDRVFPPEASDFAYGDLWAAAGRSVLAYGAWSEPIQDVAS